MFKVRGFLKKIRKKAGFRIVWLMDCMIFR